MTQIIDRKPATVKNGEATPEEVTAIVEEKTGLKLCKHCGTFKPVS